MTTDKHANGGYSTALTYSLLWRVFAQHFGLFIYSYAAQFSVQLLQLSAVMWVYGIHV